MDVLSDILSTIKLQGSLYFHTVFSPPFGVEVPAFETAARFHMVVRGTCWVAVGDRRPVALSAGDMIVIPHGAAHRLLDSADREAVTLDHVLERSGFTGEGALVYGGEEDGEEGDNSPIGVRLVCGHFAFAHGADHPLLRALPDSLLITADMRARHHWLDDAMRFMAHEVQAARPGYAATANRLSEILFLEAIRAHAEESSAIAGMMAAISDPRIGRALTAIHDAPERDWSLASLAEQAAMSRSRFAERFRDLVGTAPAAYLHEWRMQRARAMLSDGRASISQIAHDVGYRSPAAFSRAFSDALGQPPAAFRRGLQQAQAV